MSFKNSKYCIDCKHFAIDPLKIPRCKVPSEHITYSLVWGKRVTDGQRRLCVAERDGHATANEDRCGAQGKYWEARHVT